MKRKKHRKYTREKNNKGKTILKSYPRVNQGNREQAQSKAGKLPKGEGTFI